MWKKRIVFLILLCFSFALLPVMPAEAATIVTEMEDWYFTDAAGNLTEDVGKAWNLVIEFGTTSEREKPKVILDKRIVPKALSAQPDKDKIDQIVNGTVTLKAGLSEDDRRVVIAFETVLTEAGDYQMPVRINNKSINPKSKEYLTLNPGPAVIINTAEATNESPHTEFMIDIDKPKEYDTGGTEKGYRYKATVTLQLRDQYDNPTRRIPDGYNLIMKFTPRDGKLFRDYDLTEINDRKIIEDESYFVIDPNIIPDAKHSLGQLTFDVEVDEGYKSFYVPSVSAALSRSETSATEPRYTLKADIGFIPENRNTGGTLLAYQNIRVGFNDNYFTVTIDGIYPAAGKKFKLTFPSGYKVESTGKNYMFFDYDDIGKTIMVKMSSIPKKPDPDFNFDEKSLTVYPASKDENDQLTYDVANKDLGIVASGLANSAKTKMTLGKVKKAPANDRDIIAAVIQLNDINGNYTSDLADDYHVYIWAERDGKVSPTETIVQTDDSEITIEPSKDVDVDNGVEGVYEVTGFFDESQKGEIPFGVRSSLDGSAVIKAALAPNAYTAVLYRTKEEGLVSNELKVSFAPYAEGELWRFSDVKVSSIKTNELSQNNEHYQVLKTKKSNGSDKFSITALLHAPDNPNVKLSNEEVILSCSDKNVTISDKNGQSKDGKLAITTDGSGKIKFDVTAINDGTYTVEVRATNGSSAYFDIKLPYDATGGTIIDDTTSNPDSLEARLKNVSKILIDQQSSTLLAVGDTLYVRFRLYDSKGREIQIKDDDEAYKAVKVIDLTVPQGSELRSGKDKDVSIEESDGGILLEVDADKLGKYSLGMTITTGKSAKASFTVDQTKRIVGLRLEYQQLGLDLGESSSVGQLVFIDDDGKETVAKIPVNGIELSASGKPLYSFDPQTGVVRARKEDDSSGSVITVRAVDRAHNLEASYRFVVGHDILPLEFSNTSGYVHQTINMTAKVTDEFNRSLPLGALDPKRGAQMVVTVLSKPKNATIRTELEDNGSSFSQNGMNVLKVRSDRIGPVRIRVDIRAVDPNYSTKYPIYTYLSGVVDVNFNYPGILDSKPFFEGYSAGNATLMYIGSNTYVHQGQIAYMDAPPFILNDRTFVPVRTLGDSLNASTYYNDSDQSIQIYSGNNSIQMRIGSPVISTSQNGIIHSDVVPFIQDGRTYLPLRVVAEIFGCKIDPIYDEDAVIGVIFANE